MPGSDQFKFYVESKEAGLRLDTLISGRVVYLSRTLAAALIRQGAIQVDGHICKPSYAVKPAQQICGLIPPPAPSLSVAEDIPLDILFEDDHLLVVNKPPGLVIHPAAGHAGGTLVNGLLFHCPDLAGIGGIQRPGIVHRLDKDTSGLVIVAKTAAAHLELSRQFKQRAIHKRYQAIVWGTPIREYGSIDLPVGRHPVDRKKMSVKSPRGRAALTTWRIHERYNGATLLDVDLHTGRTHQIRVHCQAVGHPIIGDATYGPGGIKHRLLQCNPALYQVLSSVQRQMLHSTRLEFKHPLNGSDLVIEAPLPMDMKRVLEQLRKL